MHNVSILGFALALLSTTSAFVIPANQVDGMYSVRRSADGNDVHVAVKPMAARRSATSSAPHQFGKRDVGDVHCGCGITLNSGDTDAAVEDLKTQLDNFEFIDPSMSYYSIRGGTVAFVCNDDGNARLRAWRNEVTEAFSEITAACGLYVAGSTGGYESYSIGYMVNSDGLDFCGNSLSAPGDHC